MSAGGAISTLVWALIVIIIIVVVVVVLFKVINLLFIAPAVSATPAAYIETVGQVSLVRGVVPVIDLPILTSHFLNL